MSNATSGCAPWARTSIIAWSRPSPRETLSAVGEAIGILHQGVLVFATEDMSGVLMDCCLYDWPLEGKSRVQRYAETHTLAPGSDEHEILQAYLRAQYRILVPQARCRGAGVHFADAFSLLMHSQRISSSSWISVSAKVLSILRWR